MRKRVLLTATLATVLVACQDYGPNQTIGTGVGAGLGGLLGSQFGHGSGRLAMTGAGVLLGGLIGSSVGRSMDDADRYRMHQAWAGSSQAPVGASVEWHNPETGHYGSYTPTYEGYRPDGTYCREYQQTIVVGGRTEQGVGTACRQPDGSWRMEP